VESTDETPIDHVKDALQIAMRGLASESHFRIMTYASSTKSLGDVQPLTEDSLQATSKQIDQLTACILHILLVVFC
jgi:hypothetical protein